MGKLKGFNMNDEKCKDEWHLGWEKLLLRYGPKGAEEHYNPARTCPTCGEKKIYGD